ncbi:RNA polymerase-associated protein RapA [Puniceicoccaceae bacterium K14]|nr:RNA polymerase-associated protein RapA [Puniceicoccaceae bacterium K14]
MSKFQIGQRYVSEPEPELGLGIVDGVESYRISVSFPGSGEKRLYASDTPILKRVQFRVGEKVSTRDGLAFVVSEIEDNDGLLTYVGEEGRASEELLSDSTSFSKPHERLMNGQVDPKDAFDLRLKSLEMQNSIRQSDVRGYLGGRVDLIPHQYYILEEVASRQIPRVLLSDEVGLGKTIEACLIMQRLRAVGRAERILVLVPESLVHQWFVELLRRFNLWFSIYDEDRCRAAEASNEDGNPFLDEQLILCSVDYLAKSEVRGAQAIEARWDLVVVDEAHHLEWSPEESSGEYQLVESLAEKTPGLLLLTATPTQLGLEGHFARLRLLDSDRYSNIEDFKEESKDFEYVAEISGKIIDDDDLSESDLETLKRIFNKDEDGLEKRLVDLQSGKPGAKKSLLRALLDEHGTGRVVFRNSRRNMKDFPKRMYCPAPLPADDPAIVAKMAKELEAEANDSESSIRYNFKNDPRLDWLVAFLKARKGVKVLLICKSKQKVLALEAALLDAINVKLGLFHEDLPIVQRDRNAAWFAEEGGAQLLLCSEIGSEGRNFQFAHHLVLFDLPLNPGLLEQRIGRLDRIGQTQVIQVHVPYIVGSCQEFIAEWYHQGLDAFELCLHGGNEYLQKFGNRVLENALEYGKPRSSVRREELEVFVEETERFRADLSVKLQKGRDRLLELNSFDEKIAQGVLDRIRKADSNVETRSMIIEILDFFGVRVDEHEGGDVFIDPSHAYVEAFPSIPAEGMLATFERKRAISREDIVFVTQDHSLISESFDLLVNSDKGTASFCVLEGDAPNILLEAIFVLESVSHSKLHVDRFLSPTPIRIVVDIRGNDLSDELDPESLDAEIEDGSVNRFLERPGFTVEFLRAMLEGAEGIADDYAKKVKSKARTSMVNALSTELTRLEDLSRINDNVSDDEIVMAKKEIKGVDNAIKQSRLRLDSIRLIVQGDVDDLRADH